MSLEENFDPEGLSALVLDHNDFQRNISIDQLRILGCRHVLAAKQIEEAWATILAVNPDIILLEWPPKGDVLEFVRHIRASEETPNRAVTIFMLTARSTLREVERARAAGVDGFLRKPMATLTLQRWVKSAVGKPRAFIITDHYVGPCRRRQRNLGYAGPLRRLTDNDDDAEAAKQSEAEQRAAQARARAVVLDAAARAYRAGDAKSARAVFKAVQDLCETAEEIKDQTLSFGCREMLRYLRAQGAATPLDPEVVRTHVAALHQLAHLPVSVSAERDRVAQGLKRMIDKKLAQAAAG
jgi:CheY-like chemotaxis protein